MIGDGGGRKYAKSQFSDQNRQDAIRRVSAERQRGMVEKLSTTTYTYNHIHMYKYICHIDVYIFQHFYVYVYTFVYIGI